MPTSIKAISTGDEDVEIYLRSDGSLIIEATSDYGDSDSGWGSTTKIIHLTPDQMRGLFKDFIEVVGQQAQERSRQ